MQIKLPMILTYLNFMFFKEPVLEFYVFQDSLLSEPASRICFWILHSGTLIVFDSNNKDHLQPSSIIQRFEQLRKIGISGYLEL